MTSRPLCSRCPRLAWFDFSAGIFLCEHCTCLVLMRARIDSLKGSAEAFSAGSAVADVNARTGASAAAANSTPSDGDSSDVKPAASVPSAPEGAAGNSFNADLPIFPDRRKTTTSRVIASNATQVTKSSSDIPNHHQ